MDRLGLCLIGGTWTAPGGGTMPVTNPATGEPFATLRLGTAADAGRAVEAARAAWAGWAERPVAERIAALERVRDAYARREGEVAEAISREMGAPVRFSREAQAPAGLGHIDATLAAARAFPWEEHRGGTLILREGIGVCALITPWNWPSNQIACKVAPALVAGCTMVLKPSELAPLSAHLWAEAIGEAGLPPGVFNLVHGTGPEVGQALAAHPEVDMVSFTGSTRGGVAVALAAAPTVKRVSQELGGKSANVLLPGCDLDRAVEEGARACFSNAGQSCDAPTRMLVPRENHARAAEIAAGVAGSLRVGDPQDEGTDVGPVVSRAQWDRIQGLIGAGIAEGATLAAGGLGLPAGLNRGFFVWPTVFADVSNTMTVAREEVFGPVLSILPYDGVDEAVSIANDSPYGLAAYVQGPPEEAGGVARRLRAGQVSVNNPDWDLHAPFGGMKRSGNGREYADWGIHEFCELKAVIGA